MRRISTFFATLGPLGYLPASGTVGTCAAMPLVWALEDAALDDYILVCGLLLVGGLWIIKRALAAFDGKNHDPSEIILDEVLGYTCIFMFIPITPLSMVLAGIVFRFFDIVKPLGIRACEQLVGALGVVVDDIVAGLYTGLLLAGCIMLLERF